MLHITNGESAAIGLRRSGIPGVFLAWNDILHEGPVPAGLPLDQLSELRARFIAGRGWSSYEDALEGFGFRDNILEHFRDEQEVALWFEHDLYDQLQLLQILDWFAGQQLGETLLTLISIAAFPGFAAFHGLGELTPAQLHTLFPGRQPVTASALALAHEAWDAFCSPDPRAIEDILSRDTSALPFLAPAFRRHLQQFPAIATGLARSERQLLEALANGPSRPVPLFVATQAREEAPFLGDWPFWQYVYELSQGPAPLLVRQDGMPFQLPEFSKTSAPHPTFLAQELILTAQGASVLAGQADWLQLRGIDRWLGGVHLTGHEPAWRWDELQGRMVAATP
ncbi:MAG TPA: hypothetical protein VH591_07640 [Ktedonobacterales bacterium]|jgi:hypothetical protein